MLPVKAQFKSARKTSQPRQATLVPLFFERGVFEFGAGARPGTSVLGDDAMKIVRFLAVLALGICAAHAQDSARRGRALVREFCSACHAIGKSGNSPHKSAPPFRTLGRSFDLDQFPRRLERGISSGHPDMPEFKFNSEDAAAVRDYLRTIQQ